MKSVTLAKIAASTLILTLGCGAASETTRPGDSRLIKAAEKAAARASKAIAAKDFATAIPFAESAVASAPRDAGYRMLLGQSYLGAGRFASARSAFADTLTLSPDNGRAALNLALVEVALSDKPAALATLADYRDKLSASDYGLAMALAGNVDGGVAVLERAIRGGGVDAKTRQNLALAYALQGKWMNAKVMAVQDLSPADADARIIEWMGFVRPANAYSQVASLLGVTPAQDGGQPTQLALAGPASAPLATASAAPATSKPMTLTAYSAGGATAVASQDVTVAAPAAREPLTLVAVPAGPSPDPVAAPAQPANVATIVDTPPAAFEVPAPPPHAAPSTVFAALREIVQPTPAIRAPVKPLKQATVPTPRPIQTSAAAARFRTVEAGRYVVQLGAFASVGVAQDAWKRNAGRFGLGGFEPANANVRLRNISFVRLSVGGFSERGEATRLCVRIQKAGGSCFVRSVSGDAPAEWVRRGMPNQRLAAR